MGSLVISNEARSRLLDEIARANIQNPIVKLGLQSEVIIGSPEKAKEVALASIAQDSFRLVPHVFDRKNLGNLRAIQCGEIFVAFPSGPIRLMLGVFLGEHYVVELNNSHFVLRNSKGKIVLPRSRD